MESIQTSEDSEAPQIREVQNARLYIVGQVTIHDLAEYDKYLAGFPEALGPFEGRVLVASDQVDVIEGGPGSLRAGPRIHALVAALSDS